MTVVAVGSIRGAPGASTLALDLVRTAGADALLIEADPDGGSLAVRLGLTLKPGLSELASAFRGGRSSEAIATFAQPLPGAGRVIVAAPAAEQAQAALRAAAQHVAAALRTLDGAIVVDCGRVRPDSPSLPFALIADKTLLVCENSVETAAALAHSRRLNGIPALQIVLTAGAPYRPAEISAACGLVVWGVVPRATAAPGRRVGTQRREAARRRALASLCATCFEPVPILSLGSRHP